MELPEALYNNDDDTHSYDSVKPWDILNLNNHTTDEIRGARYKDCLGCERLFKPTRTCKECGCFMAIKTWLTEAHCPLGIWEQ